MKDASWLLWCLGLPVGSDSEAGVGLLECISDTFHTAVCK